MAQDVTRWPRRADLNTLQRISGYSERTDGRGRQRDRLKEKERREADGRTEQKRTQQTDKTTPSKHKRGLLCSNVLLFSSLLCSVYLHLTCCSPAEWNASSPFPSWLRGFHRFGSHRPIFSISLTLYFTLSTPLGCHLHSFRWFPLS